MSKNIQPQKPLNSEPAINTREVKINYSQAPVFLTQENIRVENKEEKKSARSKSITQKNLILQANQDKLYITLNRLITSKKWIVFNLIVILINVMISIYSLLTIIYPSLSKKFFTKKVTKSI